MENQEETKDKKSSKRSKSISSFENSRDPKQAKFEGKYLSNYSKQELIEIVIRLAK